MFVDLLFAALILLVGHVGQQPPSDPTVRGVVRDPTGAPIYSATVSLRTDGRKVLTTSTNATGSFELRVPYGFYELEVRETGFQGYHKQLVLKRSSGAKVYDVMLLPEEAVNGAKLLNLLVAQAAHLTAGHGHSCGVLDLAHVTQVRLLGANQCVLRSLQQVSGFWICYVLPSVDSTVLRCMASGPTPFDLHQISVDSAAITSSTRSVPQISLKSWERCPDARVIRMDDGGLSCATHTSASELQVR